MDMYPLLDPTEIRYFEIGVLVFILLIGISWAVYSKKQSFNGDYLYGNWLEAGSKKEKLFWVFFVSGLLFILWFIL